MLIPQKAGAKKHELYSKSRDSGTSLRCSDPINSGLIVAGLINGDSGRTQLANTLPHLFVAKALIALDASLIRIH